MIQLESQLAMIQLAVWLYTRPSHLRRSPTTMIQP